MVRSLYSGVSGLKNHQVRMDVLGNNISNVNTIGFKKGRTMFQSMLSQSISGAAKPGADKGGVNPKQVGLGMNIAAIDTIHTQGSAQVTGKNTDLMIMGEGFFVVQQGAQRFFTRAGNFSTDRDGLLVNPADGLKLQGWQASRGADGKNRVNTSTDIGDIKIPIGSKDPAKATTNVRFKCNLKSLTPVIQPNAQLAKDFVMKNTHFTNLKVYDAYGKARNLSVSFTRQGTNLWRAQIDVKGATNVTADVPGGPQNASNIVYFSFNRNGTVAGVHDRLPNSAPANLVANNKLFANLRFNLPDGSQNSIQLNFGTAGLADGVTQYDSKSTTKAVEQDGYTMGYMQAFSIDSSGEITGVYSNGQKRTIGQVAMATFTNPGGLEKNGSTYFTQSNNSGTARISAANTEDKGSIRSGALEMSNVDLSEEFTDMIVTQRGFQANSRVITTSDQMLQELLTLKR